MEVSSSAIVARCEAAEVFHPVETAFDAVAIYRICSSKNRAQQHFVGEVADNMCCRERGAINSNDLMLPTQGAQNGSANSSGTTCKNYTHGQLSEISFRSPVGFERFIERGFANLDTGGSFSDIEPGRQMLAGLR